MKYLFKNWYKGHDCALIKIQDADVKFWEKNEDTLEWEHDDIEEYDYDGIRQFINTRYYYITTKSYAQTTGVSLTWYVTCNKYTI